MKTIELKKTSHSFKTNGRPPVVEPNIVDSCLFLHEGVPIGFYLKELPEKARKLLEIANYEFLSPRVPKQMMNRGKNDGSNCSQYSTILGTVPPKAIFKRNYNSTSSVHGHNSAHVFIKAMKQLCKEGECLIQKYLPEQYEKQKQQMLSVPEEWRFTDLFTSSISNYNIAANYHQDNRNIKHTVNLIFTRRKNSEGGCLHVPDFNICVEQADSSLLAYPAWSAMHGVTDIKQVKAGGYRNSLIFYPLVIK